MASRWSNKSPDQLALERATCLDVPGQRGDNRGDRPRRCVESTDEALRYYARRQIRSGNVDNGRSKKTPTLAMVRPDIVVFCHGGSRVCPVAPAGVHDVAQDVQLPVRFAN